MKKLSITLAVISAFLISSCTQNELTKNFGGSMTVKLDKGKQLMNVTWKEDELWILTKQMDSTHTPTNYEFVENSSYGLLEGKVTITESK